MNPTTTQRFLDAVQHGDLQAMELALDLGADINTHFLTGDHDTALIFATKKKNHTLVRWLLRHHADPNTTNTIGETALHHATGQPRLWDELTWAGASDTLPAHDGLTARDLRWRSRTLAGGMCLG